MDSRIRSILVGVGPEPDPATLETAVALARREHARLTILAAVVEPSALTYCVPFGLPVDLAREALVECRQRLQKAVDSVPPDVPVTALLRRGSARAALRAEARKHDVLVLGGHSRRRTAPSLLRGGAPVRFAALEGAGL
jgi:hypothetical protein